jgi:hypothetical protein
MGEIGPPGNLKNGESVKDVSKIKESFTSLVGPNDGTFNYGEQSNQRKFSAVGGDGNFNYGE